MESINILIASAHRGINNALEAAVLDVCYNRVFAHFTRTASLNDLVRFGRSGNYGLLIVVAAHVQPVDVWYLLPIAAVGRAKSLRFYPDIKSRRPMWEEYREAWKVLGER